MAKSSKTAAERAQESLDTADRVVARLVKRINTTKADLDELGRELKAAQVKRDYLAQNPDLPKQPAEAKSEAVE